MFGVWLMNKAHEIGFGHVVLGEGEGSSKGYRVVGGEWGLVLRAFLTPQACKSTIGGKILFDWRTRGVLIGGPINNSHSFVLWWK